MKQEKLDGFMVTGEWNRRYLSGFTGSNGVLLITKNVKQLITDYRYVEQAGQQTDYDIILHAGHTGHKGRIFSEVAKQVNDLRINRLGFEQQHLNYGDYCTISELMETELCPTFDIVEDIRMIKSEGELELLRIASKITDDAYLDIVDKIKPGLTELDVAEELNAFIKKRGGTTTGFPPIVASGIRSSMPHGRASDKVLEKGDMITIDFGANYKGYWSDISRTVSIGEPSGQMKEIQEVTLASFENCIDNIQAGLTDEEVDWFMREYLMKLGFNEQSGTGTGHGIGLEVHEKPLFSILKEKELKTNMTVTVEPGIYLPNIGGARVEDVLLITNNGCESLTPSTKKLITV